ncbi:MAG: SCO family protein [Vulcanimicrobiaceae bacterium]
MRRAPALLTLFLVFACAGPVFAARGGEDPRRIPLVDQSGAPFRLADLRGAPAFVTFIATRCTDACPIANAEFERLSESVRAAHLRAHLVTITLDPDYDTPIVMWRTAREFAADGRTWRLVSGNPANVRAEMRAFGVTAEKDAHGIPDLHSSFVYVLDARGRLARTMPLSTNFPAEALALVRARAIALATRHAS